MCWSKNGESIDKRAHVFCCAYNVAATRSKRGDNARATRHRGVTPCRRGRAARMYAAARRNSDRTRAQRGAVTCLAPRQHRLATLPHCYAFRGATSRDAVAV